MPSFFVAYSAIELHIPPKSLPILPELSRFFPLLFMPLIIHARIQGRRRVLEDDLHIALDIFLVLPVGALFRDQKVFEANLAFCRGINAHNGARHRRLAAAGFPDQPEDFPLSQVERNPVDGVHRQGLVDGEMLLVVSDG